MTAKAWSKKIAPAIPLMNTSGTKTAIVVKVELSIGVITSVVPLLQASSSESPRVLYWVMFSVTMIELSIIIPKARINPEMEMIFSDILQR